MHHTQVLRALADERRLQIVELLLAHNYCVRALARKLGVSEAAVSQHLKVLREAGLLVGEKRGYYMHYDVDRQLLRALADEIAQLAALERQACSPAEGGCAPQEAAHCHNGGRRGHRGHGHPHGQGRGCHRADEGCTDEVRAFCHGEGPPAWRRTQRPRPPARQRPRLSPGGRRV